MSDADADPKELVLTKTQMDALVAHAMSELPNEACGMLFGHDLVVERVRPIKNIEPSPVSYVFDSKDQLKAMKEMSGEGLGLVGIYHSHPESPPIPSLTDIKRSFFPETHEPNFPDAVYLIIGLADDEPEPEAFTIDKQATRRVPIHIKS